MLINNGIAVLPVAKSMHPYITLVSAGRRLALWDAFRTKRKARV